MRWLLAGFCGLALISISVAVTITQKPRFMGVKTRRTVGIYCSIPSNEGRPLSIQWLKAGTDGEKQEVKAEQRVSFQRSKDNRTLFLLIKDARIEDSGVYFCKVNNELGPGTAVQVAKPIDVAQAEYRSKVKDGLIILQGLVLAVCIAAILLRKRNLMDKKDSIYEEPETDHIYEGLAIETCGGGLYEELSVYAQAEGAEAPWE